MKKQTDNSPKPKKIPRKITTQEPPKVVEKEPEQSQQMKLIFAPIDSLLKRMHLMLMQ